MCAFDPSAPLIGSTTRHLITMFEYSMNLYCVQQSAYYIPYKSDYLYPVIPSRLIYCADTHDSIACLDGPAACWASSYTQLSVIANTSLDIMIIHALEDGTASHAR